MPVSKLGLSAAEQKTHIAPTTSRQKKNRVVPELLLEVEKKYSTSKTLVADFTQIIKKPSFNRQTTRTGVLKFKRPDKMKWETLLPESDQNIMISDGVTFWYYTPPFDSTESGQVIEKKSAEVQTRLAHTLLSGAFSQAKDMRLKQTGPFEFSIDFKKSSAGHFKRANLIIDPVKHLIKKVILNHSDGGQTDITLSKIQLGTALSDEEFHFKIPPNTDRLEEKK